MAVAIAVVALLPFPASAQWEGMTIVPLSDADALRSERQREHAGALARRYIGSDFGAGSMRDLRLIQRLLDSRRIAKDDALSLQSLGVVLGDIMADDFGLRWVAVDDRYGHSRALRFRESAELFFPVTMISKRVMRGDRADVRALYDKVGSSVEKLSRRSD